MKIIFLIIKREYLVRVRKKSFLVMTILGPLLIAAFYGLAGWAAISSIDQKKVQVVDESGQFTGKFKNSSSLLFTFVKTPITAAKKAFPKSGNDVLVYIPKDVLSDSKGVQLFAEKGVSFDIKSGIERTIEKEIETEKGKEKETWRSRPYFSPPGPPPPPPPRSSLLGEQTLMAVMMVHDLYVRVKGPV